MKVLHLDSGRQMRGGQWQALYLMVGQKTLGWDPMLLAPGRSPLLKEAAARGVVCAPLSLWSVARESKLCDITHAHDARSHTMAALAARTPFVVSRRVGFPVRMGMLSRWKYSKPARYLAISIFVAKQLIAAGVPEDRVGIVYDGAPVEGRTPGIGDRLISPAWDDPRKGAALATESARLAGVPLLLSSQLAEDLISARSMLYLSDMEGLGSAALLALSIGVPVIASNVGGLPEIVHDGITGLLVENKPEQVALAIRKLMQDRELAARLGKQGREMVKGGFTLAHMALRTIHEYKKVLQ
ncbi:MAG TPA: glycosyltransferase family 4 protein [Bryobacteraceae bacterium]|nr:glycosyltransferase family 4 protein [Bryobacteraceae bacterium]